MNITFKDLKKYAQKEIDNNQDIYKLIVMGDCATQFLSVAINGLSKINKINIKVIETDYDQISLNVYDDNSVIYNKEVQGVFIVMCTEKLCDKFYRTDIENRINFADTIMEEILRYWNKIINKSKINIFQTNFAIINDNVFGSYGVKLEQSFSYQLRKLNFLISQNASKYKELYIVDVDDVKKSLGENDFKEDKMYYYAKVAFSQKAVCDISNKIVELIKVTMGHFNKCLVLDLDNTLWGGVIGDDGINNIELGEIKNGPVFVALQKWIKELRNRGIILAVCSKNNDEVAKEPFLKHPDMILKLDDISIFVANWEDKVSNIKYIQKTLNIGMDSIVFIDDNKFEREAVKFSIPQVTVPDLPEDPAQYLSFLQSLNLFETVNYSKEDTNRTNMYRTLAIQNKYKESFTDYNDYLKSLEMVCSFNEFDEFYNARISQLTQRSNQFNVRTIRYTEGDIEKIRKNSEYITCYFVLKDKFINHGLISVVILEKRGETLFIDTWLMSCRVLKRGMEEFCVNEMYNIAKKLKVKKIIGEYIQTEKNSMVKSIYSDMGFDRIGDNMYEMNIEDFTNKKTYITGE